ncbi:trehalase [bacterium BMS3Abin10]|nr:trehalase [bacterium BMS3Abin10]
MYKKISDYGIIGNLHSIALVGLDGSIDWLCLPHIDSPSVFGALLDDGKGGYCSVSPVDEWDSTSEYRPGTNILMTMFRTRTGIMRITDFMPVCSCGIEVLEKQNHELYRFVEVLKGRVNARLVFEPRFNYARAETVLEGHDLGVIAKGNGESLVLSSGHKLNISENRAEAEWQMSEGESKWLHLAYEEEKPAGPDKEKAERSLLRTFRRYRSRGHNFPARRGRRGKELGLPVYMGEGRLFYTAGAF